MRNLKANKRLSSFKYDKTLITIIVVLLLMSALLVPIFTSNSFSIIVSIGVILSAALALVTRNCYECNRKVSNLLYILIITIGIIFLINGIFYRVLGYIVIGITFSAVVPVLFCYISSGNIKKIYTAIADGIIISFLIILFISVFFGPRITSKQYYAIFSNPNIVGNLGIITNAAVLYRLLSVYDKKKVLLYIILGSLNISVCILSNSRTSMIAIILQILIYVFLAVRCKYENLKILHWVKKFLCVVLVGVVSFVSVFYALKIEFSWIDESKFAKDDISFEERMELSSKRFLKGLNDDKKREDAFTSGRLGIWKIYLDDVGFKGHAVESKDIVNGERVYHNTNAHNAYLQVAYSAGIIAGLAYLLIAIMVFFKSIKLFIQFLKKRKIDDEIVYAIFSAVGFGMASITSAGYMMFTYLPVTFFLLSVNLLFIKKKSK